MPLLDYALVTPRYGYEKNGLLIVPTHQDIFREFFYNLNIFRDKKNWLSLFSWFIPILFTIPLVLFFAYYITLPLFIFAFIYSMVIMGTHGTIYYHRYATHRAYQFRHPIFRFLVRHLVIKTIPEEVYVVSHYVHHAKSEKPGDPYNVHGGWLYCFLADVTHQPISKNLSMEDYLRVSRMLDHTGVYRNSYEQYLKWGSICNPLLTILHFGMNWGIWFLISYFIGGIPLTITLFASAGFWAYGVRTFNYDGHGGGKDKRKEGIDFNREDLSINQLWPGLVTGEWHNNHHLYPNGARAGFLPYQLDYAWWFIKMFFFLGAISSYRDYKEDFMKNFYLPYLAKKKSLEGSSENLAPYNQS